MKRSYKIGMLGLVAGLALTVVGAPHWWTSAEADGAKASNGYYCGSYNGKTGTGMMNGNGYGMMGGNFSGTNMAEIHNQMMNHRGMLEWYPLMCLRPFAETIIYENSA